MSEQNSKTSPFSYHTFIFPFIWNQNGKITRELFEKCKHPCWTLDVRQDVPFDQSLYAQYCYFNQAARNVIFMEEGEQNPIVRNFKFDIGKLSGDREWFEENKIRYIIKKDTFVATLCVNSIRLRLFDTGVGMIVFELENYEYNTEREITLINEYGRRVFMPYIDEKGGCKLCADTITLQYPGGEIVSTISGAKLQHNSEICFFDLILRLLTNGTYSATTNINRSKNQFFIEPIIDDRMFVSCVWRNNDFALEMQKFENGEYCYLSDALAKAPDDKSNTAGRMYELLFVDGDGLSCRSRTMLHNMLEDHVYHRWLEYSSEYGTIAGITEYSMVTVSGDLTAVNAHLTEYTEMVMLVLAQRASLLAFERQISDCARGKLGVDKIQKAYVHFQSEYLLREVTPQQQGIELYDMLLDNLYIEEARADVEKEISALFDLEKDVSEKKDNVLLSILAALGLLDVTEFILSEHGCLPNLLSAIAIGGLLLWFGINHRKSVK